MLKILKSWKSLTKFLYIFNPIKIPKYRKKVLNIKYIQKNNRKRAGFQFLIQSVPLCICMCFTDIMILHLKLFSNVP